MPDLKESQLIGTPNIPYHHQRFRSRESNMFLAVSSHGLLSLLTLVCLVFLLASFAETTAAEVSILRTSTFLLTSSSSSSPAGSSIYDNTEEQTFVAIKPDAVQRNLMGEIIKRIESKGLKVVGMKMLRPSEHIVMEHYSEHKHQPFFRDLVDFFTSGPVVAMAVQGKNAIHITRKLIGKTQPEDAEPGTIRGDYCFGKGRNLIHSSDSMTNAMREINLWFHNPDDILTYTKSIDGWVKLQSPPPAW